MDTQRCKDRTDVLFLLLLPIPLVDLLLKFILKHKLSLKHTDKKNTVICSIMEIYCFFPPFPENLPQNDNGFLEPEGLYFPREEAVLKEVLSMHTA